MRTYRNDMPHAEYPLGGIGTGTVTLCASGRLSDFQIFNHPHLGAKSPYSFFAMYTRWGEQTDARALEAESAPDFYQGRGYHPQFTMGLPKFESSEMTVQVPFAKIKFADKKFPFKVSLEAYNPFIPSCADDSGIPGAIFHFDVENTTDKDAEVLIASSMGNIYNYHGRDAYDNYLVTPNCENRAVRETALGGVFMTGSELKEDALGVANCAILTPEENAEIRPVWYRGGWYDGVTDFWNNFKLGKIESSEADSDEKFSVVGPASPMVGTVGVRKTLKSGEKARFTFVMSWYVPNRIKGWGPEDNPGQTMKNYYATKFTDALDVGKTLINRMAAFEESGKRFADALYATDFPEPFVDAMASNISVLRSTTCWRAPDGTFVSWEGSHEQEGSCIGTCTHVWNYAQTVASLFPELEKSARLNEFLGETNADGKMTFRTRRIFDLPDWEMYPAADGQYGTIMRAWREYKLSGDREYLKTIYPKVLLAFDYGMRVWDENGDGVPEARQHNTYDIEFFGENPLSGVMMLGAAKAVIAMAKELGDEERAAETQKLFDKAQANFDKLCWNGEYYIQHSDDINRYPYQFGEGCLSDQLFGQTMASLIGLGELLPKEKIASAINAVYKYNFLPGDKRNPCLQRLFVANDEKAMVLCSWPNGNTPRFPFVYCDEVWTGIEYQVVTLMIYCGMIDEAVDVVKNIRARFDGVRRSPWNEMECGFYYTRAMASWGLLIAMSGFDCNAEKGWVKFAPKQDKCTTFWSMGGAWGTASFDDDGMKLNVKFGALKLNALNLPFAVKSASLNGEAVAFAQNGQDVCFTDTVIVGTDETLIIKK